MYMGNYNVKEMLFWGLKLELDTLSWFANVTAATKLHPF